MMASQIHRWVGGWFGVWLLVAALACSDDDSTGVAGDAGGDAGVDATAPAQDDFFEPADPVAAAAAGYSGDIVGAAMQVYADNRSTGAMILWDGKVLAENYWEVSDPSTDLANLIVGTTDDGLPIEDVASVQKSVLSFLVAVARDRGELDIEQPVTAYLGEGWSQATPEQEAAITVRHLLNMTSGLTGPLAYREPAGTVFEYNTIAIWVVSDVLAAAAGESIQELTRTRLTDPVGMVDSEWVDRQWVKDLPALAAAPIGFATTVRDLARFGQLILQQGRWGRQELLSDTQYLADALSPSQVNENYGLGWWVNHGDPPRSEAAPTDLVSAIGAAQRYVHVIPSLDLVVVRLGDLTPVPVTEPFFTALLAEQP